MTSKILKTSIKNPPAAENEFDQPAYTPQFTLQISAAVRRLAWFLNKPMTETVKILITALPAIMDTTKICNTCRDKSICNSCIFCPNFTAENNSVLLSAF